jgi:hypothetical protein
MTTVEITRHKQAASGVKLSHLHIVDIRRREGLAGINKGVNVVALRQMTNWRGVRGMQFIHPEYYYKILISRYHAEWDSHDLPSRPSEL